MSRETGVLDVDTRRYKIVTLDFETYYDDEYTLSKGLNTSEYIRDERFHPHGVGIKIGAGKTLWYTGHNIALALGEIDWKSTALLAHNTPFDGFICSDVYGHTPAMYLDTLSMARGAHGHHTRHDLHTLAKLHGLKGKVRASALANTKGKLRLTDAELRALGRYCSDDVNDTYELFWKLHGYIPDEELRLIDMTLRMFCDPVLRVDMPRVQAALDAEVGGKVSAILKTGVSAEDLMSNAKFADILSARGVSVPLKISPTTGRTAYAFAKADLEFKKLLAHPNPDVVALAEARIKVKSTIGETRAMRFLKAGENGKSLPVLLNYAGAHTLRWSGGNKMNLQNLKRGGELRRSILAPPGHVVVVADSAQIEARILAWLAGQDDIVAAFARKDDVYKLMASAIYGVPVGQVTDEQRFIGKVCVLGLGYGMGATKLQLTLAQGVMGPPVQLTFEVCDRIVQVYRSRNYKIRALWKTMDGVIASMIAGVPGQLGPLEYGKGFIRLPNGMFLQYYGLRGDLVEGTDRFWSEQATYMTRNGMAKIYGGLLTENVVQALARVVIADQMLAINDTGYRVVTMSHDEIVTVCPEKQADKCYDTMVQIMSTAPSWAKGLPLEAKGGYDKCYSK